MSAIDLTEARAAGEAAWMRSYFSGAPARVAREDYLTAATPLIARQVADSIAAEIEAERTDVLLDSDGADSRPDWLAAGLARAVRIAREWSPA